MLGDERQLGRGEGKEGKEVLSGNDNGILGRHTRGEGGAHGLYELFKVLACFPSVVGHSNLLKPKVSFPTSGLEMKTRTCLSKVSMGSFGMGKCKSWSVGEETTPVAST